MLNYFSLIDHRMQPGDCQCGTGRTYLVKFMMYVLVPQKLFFFPKNPSEKGLCLSMWECPNLFSLVKSIFIGHIFFHWSNLFSEIYGVRPSALKIDFFPKNPSEKRLCLTMWERLNLFPQIKSSFVGQKGFVC